MLKISRLKISKLYNVYDYDINFNSDVTFLFGANGCGKTTILNITEAIITGQLYKLFKYNFNSISLFYYQDTKKGNKKLIKIERENERVFTILFNKEKHPLENIEIFNDFSGKRIIREWKRAYDKNYNFLNEIKETFNYVYLPLNRYVSYISENDHYDREYYDTHSAVQRTLRDNNINLENSIKEAKILIDKNMNRINIELSKCDNEFRNSVLMSLLEVNTKNTIHSCISDVLNKKINVKNIEQIRNAYLKTLKLLDKTTESSVKEDNVATFFDTFIKNYKYYYSLENNDIPASREDFDILDLVTKYQEIKRTQKIVELYEKIEVKKEKIYKPVKLFTTTMNQFFANDLYSKEITFDDNGYVKFKENTTNEILDIQYLSSGEKQILIFFANLIFNVESGKSGIFVVDEPELSLHLYWQKIFVEKALSLNSNLQLIFATHAPKIVGNYSQKMVKLERRVSCE